MSWLDDNTLSVLAEYEFNGREIKNVVRMAYALAVDEGKALGFERALGLEHLQKAAKAVKLFELEMAQEQSEVDVGNGGSKDVLEGDWGSAGDRPNKRRRMNDD